MSIRSESETKNFFAFLGVRGGLGGEFRETDMAYGSTTSQGTIQLKGVVKI